MRTITPAARPRGRNALLGMAAGLLLMVGGVCGVGPTSLSVLAVTARQPLTEDIRVQASVPLSTDVSTPTRRVIRRNRGGFRARVSRKVAGVRRVVAGFDRVPLGRSPPLRGPPAVVMT